MSSTPDSTPDSSPESTPDSTPDSSPTPSGILLRIAQFCTIFIGAFLIFQIQPIVSKIVTPKFGGTSAVWTCCLMFFQLVLLAGYLLTYFLSKLSPKKQAIIYGALFLLSMIFCSVKAPAVWESGDAAQPFISLVTILGKNLFIQCLLLSSVSGMIQLWYRLASLGSPYWLYALSNIGSLGALLTYPLIIEPNMTLPVTIQIWNIAYLVLAILILISALYVFRKGEVREQEALEKEGSSEAPSVFAFSYWCFLTAMTSASLICYSQHLTQDIAPIPLLWVAPLILFLLSYIICFANDKYCKSLIYLVAASVLWIFEPFLWRSIEWNTVCILGFVFCFSMGLHSELVKSKPKPKHLATFYLATAIGGALGGLFENLAAPNYMDFYGEKIIFFVVLLGLLVVVMLKPWLKVNLSSGGEKNKLLELVGKPNPFLFGIASFLVLILAYVGFMIVNRMVNPDPEVVVRMRDFYGCVSVEKNDHSTSLVHGNVIHGTQLNTPGKEREPTRYFATNGGIGISYKVMREKLAGKPLDCAVLGLGAGTIACYTEKNDSFVYYEIDPNVVKIAREYFTFLSDSPAETRVVLGDGRIELAREKGDFNLIMLDAFNGNAVPVHLLTTEAFDQYLKHLTPDGFMLVNISNRHVNLQPLLGNIAKKYNFNATTFSNDTSTWVLMSKESYEQELAKFSSEELYGGLRISKTYTDDKVRLWSDNFSNVLSLLIHK